MKDEKIKKLQNELKYLLDADKEKEINNVRNKIDEKTNVKELAKEIYSNRGINYDKLNKGILNNLMETLNDFSSIFKGKDAKTKRKMIFEVIYIVVILVLIKVPFDLVRDIGYDYIKILSKSAVYFNLWNLAFLVLYTITFICSFIVLIRNFNSKYKD